MNIIKQPWFIILTVVAAIYTWQYYQDPKIFQIVGTEAEAVSIPEDEKAEEGDSKGKPVIHVQVSEQFKVSQAQSFQLSNYIPLQIKFSKTDSPNVIVTLMGDSDLYRNDGQKLSDWFQVQSKNGQLNIRPYERTKKFEGIDSLKDLAKVIGGKKDESEKSLTMIIEVPENHRFQEMVLESVSQDVFASDLRFLKMKVATVSGNLTMKKSEGDELKVECVSGDSDLEIKGLKIAKFESVSGDTKLNVVETVPDIKFESVSGDLSLTLPESGDVEVSFESMTGELINDFGVSKKAAHKINFESLSGSATINKIK